MSFLQIKNTIMIFMATIGSIFSTMLGGWDMAIITLLSFMAIDYITGIMVAGIFKKSPKTECGTLDSCVGKKGLRQKGVICMMVIIGVLIDLLFKLGSIARTTFILFYISNEGLSIIENVGLMGVPLPSFLKRMFEQLKSDNNNPINGLTGKDIPDKNEEKE